MAGDVAIKVTGVSKTFKLPHEKHTSVKGWLINAFRGRTTYERQRVLNNVSLEIKKGEFFGIVGRNGSGKSTLLKLMAGVYSPDSGAIAVNGKLTPFIELGVGFNSELTGRENVFLNGALMGFSRREMEKMYDEIVEFAELERFMDQKLKNYSSGMQVRLAFSVAIRARSDILLLDEVLAVGDEAFQRKCYEYFEDLKRDKKTVILVTHDMSAVEKFCDRGILIELGEIIKEGEAGDIVGAYPKLFGPVKGAKKKKEPEETKPEKAKAELEPRTVEKVETKNRWGNKHITIDSILLKQTGKHDAESNIEMRLKIRCNKPVAGRVSIGYTFRSKDETVLIGNILTVKELGQLEAGNRAKCVLSIPNILKDGSYQFDISVRELGHKEYCDYWMNSASLIVKNNKRVFTKYKTEFVGK